MRKTALILTADLHLCSYIWKSRPDITGDAFKALDNIGAVARGLAEQGYSPAVVMAGDIFNSKAVDTTTEETFDLFMRGMDAIKASVYIIEGNHEKDTEPPRACLFRAKRLSLIPTKIGPFTVCGFDYEPSQSGFQEKMANTPPCDWLVCHGSEESLMPFTDGDGKGVHLKASDVPKHIKNMLIGDIHVRKEIPIPSGGVLLSPGSTHPRSATEFDREYSVTLVLEGVKELLKVDVGPRIYSKHVVDGFDEIKKIEDKLKKDIAFSKENDLLPPIYIIKHPGDEREIVEGARRLSDLGACIITEKKASIIKDSPVISTSEFPSLGSELPLYIREDDPLHNVLQGCISNPEDTEKLLTEYLERMEKDVSPDKS